jgi:hypothetical protein
MDWILIPAELHIDPLTFADYPLALKMRIRDMMPRYLMSKHNG